MDSDQKLLSTHCYFGTKLLIVQAREKKNQYNKGL